MLVRLQDIKIGNRFRKDVGDIGPLVDSIKRQGLLHPIVLTEENELVCGRRRIEAYRKLNLTEIEANLVSFIDSNLGEAEADENIVRKNFTNFEIAEIYAFYREKEEYQSRQRMLAGKQVPLGKFPKGRSLAKIAERVGVSYKTLDKIREIKEASIQNPHPEIAKIWDKVGKGRIKVDKGYNKVKQLQTIQQAERLALKNPNPILNGSNFILELGPMEELGNVILDPFMGSGTTGEAALKLNRKFIGIEVNPIHYSSAAQRLSKFAVTSVIPF